MNKNASKNTDTLNTSKLIAHGQKKNHSNIKNNESKHIVTDSKL